MKTVLITGANSGLGFDSARQLVQTGRWRVVLSARSNEKAERAVEALRALTNAPHSSLGSIVFDNNLPETVQAAVEALRTRGETLDAIVLNAGGIATPDGEGKPRRTASGLSQVYAMNVDGHARLVNGLLNKKLLTPGATIVFSGSEAARGIPTIGAKAPTLPEGFNSLDEALEAAVTGQHGGPGYDPMEDYGLTKLIGTVWMRHLHHAHGLRALTVSPGFTAGTNGMESLPAGQRFMFKYVLLPMLRLFGNAHGLSTGAARYLRGVEDESLEAGGFYASPGTKMSGALHAQGSDAQPLLDDANFAAAVERVVKRRLQPTPAATAAQHA